MQDFTVLTNSGAVCVVDIKKKDLLKGSDLRCTARVKNVLPSSDIPAMARRAEWCERHDGFYYVGGPDGIIAFSSSPVDGLVMKQLNANMYYRQVNARSFLQTGENEFLINTSAGMYRYSHAADGCPGVSLLTKSEYDIDALAAYNFDGTVDKYALIVDGSVYRTENCRVVQYDFPVGIGRITSVCPHNAHEWYFGTEKGLYGTGYQYTEVDDIAKFSENELYELYADLLSSEIDEMYEDLISRHELLSDDQMGHTGSSIVNMMNQNLVGTDFSGLDQGDWQR